MSSATLQRLPNPSSRPSPRVPLPRLHPHQSEVYYCLAKRIICLAGRRAGKTTLAAYIGVRRFWEGKRVLFCSATQDQSDAFWEKCCSWLAYEIGSGRVLKNESRRLLTRSSTLGRIRVKTASNPDALRGDFADLVVLDEAALLDPDTWQVVGPMLIDRDGTVMMLSTPRPRGLFRDLYTKAIADTTGRWAAFKWTSFDNPYLSSEALSEMSEDLTSEARRQELEAEFLESQSSVFRGIDAALTAPASEPSEHAAHRVVAGLDFAQVVDKTALSALCVDCRNELALDYFNRLDWAFQRERIKAFCQTWSVRLLLAEHNSIGGPNIEQLALDGLPVRAWTTTQATKARLVQGLALSFEKGETRWTQDRLGRAELETFEVTFSSTTGLPRYSAPPGGSDDTIIARGLAYQAAIMVEAAR